MIWVIVQRVERKLDSSKAGIRLDVVTVEERCVVIVDIPLSKQIDAQLVVNQIQDNETYCWNNVLTISVARVITSDASGSKESRES